MADTTPDFGFDFSDIPPGSQDHDFNDLFADVDFGENFDPEFETRLAKDYPVTEEQASSTLPPRPEAPVLMPSPQHGGGTCLQQQQFINPQHTLNAPQPTYTSAALNDAHGLNINWPPGHEQQVDIMLAQDLDTMLAQDPIFASQPNSNYFPINQINDQPLIHSQLVLNPTHGQQMLRQDTMDRGHQVTWPLQQGIPQPMLQPMPQPNLQPMIQLIPQQTLQPIPPPMPQPRPPGMPPPPHPPQLIPSRPIPREPLPQGTYKRVDPGADSFITLKLRGSRNSRELPSAGTKTTSPPLKRPTKNHNGEALLNDRIPRKTHQNKGPGIVEPEKYYGPSPSKPRDWGPRNARGKHLFTYTEKGELAAGLYLTAREMRLYLLGPSPRDDPANFTGPFRLPGVKLRTKKKRQGLTLWVGWPAAMSNTRYPRGGESTKCRFKNCPYRQHTISLGDPWVILDERQNEDGEAINPFHNAGYVHLFCLESNFDIVDLWQCLDIRPDYRTFKRESHPYFNLAYRLPGIDVVVKEWWHAAFKNWELARSHGVKRVRTHEFSLTQALVSHKLENEPKAQVKNRLKRGGADIAKHRGDPEVKRRLVTFRRYGLLDDAGWPVLGADKLLEDMQNSRQPGNKSNPIMVPNSLASPVLDYSQQYQYPTVDSRQPAYNTEPVYPVTHPGPSISTDPYALVAAGNKRSWDDAIPMPDQTASELPMNQEAPSPKRQRLDYAQPVTETLLTLTPSLSVPPGQAGTETQLYYPQNDDLNALAPLIDYLGLPDLINQEQGNDILDSFFDDPAATSDKGKPSGNIDGREGGAAPQSESAPTSPRGARVNNSDSDNDNCDGLFGRPETPNVGGLTPPTHHE